MSKKIRCPTCRRPTVWEGNQYRPFCSERCKLLDLGNWASDRYRIPGPPAAMPSDDRSEDEEDEAE